MRRRSPERRKYTIRSIPCLTYADPSLFRSTLEAKWATVLTHLHLKYEYEPEWARVPKYQIDFWTISELGSTYRFIEVKFSPPSTEERRRIANLARQIRKKTHPNVEFWFLVGRPPQDLINFCVTRLPKKQAIDCLSNLNNDQKHPTVNRSNPQINQISDSYASPKLTFEELVDRKHLIQFKPAKHAPKKILH